MGPWNYFHRYNYQSLKLNLFLDKSKLTPLLSLPFSVSSAPIKIKAIINAERKRLVKECSYFYGTAVNSVIFSQLQEKTCGAFALKDSTDNSCDFVVVYVHNNLRIYELKIVYDPILMMFGVTNCLNYLNLRMWGTTVTGLINNIIMDSHSGPLRGSFQNRPTLHVVPLYKPLVRPPGTIINKFIYL